MNEYFIFCGCSYYYLLALAERLLLRQTFFFVSGTNTTPPKVKSRDIIKKPNKKKKKAKTLPASHLHISQMRRRDFKKEELVVPQALQHPNRVSRWLAFPKLASFISLAGAGKCQRSGLRLDHKGSS